MYTCDRDNKVVSVYDSLVSIQNVWQIVHCNGFIHNDLKTDNVALVKLQIVNGNDDQSREWNPVILDFGEATKPTAAVIRKYQSFHPHVDPDILSGQVTYFKQQ